MKIVHFAIALLAASSVQAAAREPGREAAPPQVRVQYDDLNLRTAAGVETLDRRLARAVRAVCPDARGTIEVKRKAAARKCVSATSMRVAEVRTRILAEQGASPMLAGYR